MISIRLPLEIEKKLLEISKMQKKTKTQLIKEALNQFLNTFQSHTSPYELGKDLFGRFGSEQTNLSQNYKQLLKAKINAKHPH